MKAFFQKNWIHFAAIAVMLIIVAVYFSPQFDGYRLKQHDIQQWKGMAQETQYLLDKTGEQSLWTNSMFGGMPTVQISMYLSGNIIQSCINFYYKVLPSPAGLVFLHMISFYLMALLLRIRPIIGVIGAVAFSFASYELIILQAGHAAKSMASAYLPLLLGTFVYAYQRKSWLGVVLSSIVMTLELASNHVQVTYYMIFVLLFFGLYFLYSAIKNKEIASFLKITIGLFFAYALAGVINSPNILLTNDYAKNTIRGVNDITILPDGTEVENQSQGLDRDYITNWSYGIGETFTLVSPNVKGGGSFALGDSQFNSVLEASDLSTQAKNTLANYPAYWGDQPFTSGPVYIGVIVALLAFLGLIFIKSGIKWPLLAATILAIALSWGKNYVSVSVLLPIILFSCIPIFKGKTAFLFAVGNTILFFLLLTFGDVFASKSLTNFFIDYVPGYDKFRTVTIVLIIVELCIPVLGVVFLDLLIKEKEKIKERKNLLIGSVAGFFLLLMVVKIAGLNDNYTNQSDKNQLAGIKESITNQIASIDPNELKTSYGIDVNNMQQVNEFVDAQMKSYEQNFEDLKIVRKDIFMESMNRSLIFTFLAGILIIVYVLISIPSLVLMGGMLILVMLDMLPVANEYLGKQEVGSNYKYWEDFGVNQYPVAARAADEQVLQMEVQANSKLKNVIDLGEKKGKEMAEEIGIEGSGRQNLINSYRFAELNLATNYRVFDVTGGFNSSHTSYFHKSLGGYHGAKLRNFSNLIDFQIAKGNNKVFDMMNVKYILQDTEQGLIARPNPGAMGNAWVVKNVETYATPNDEIRALGTKFKLINEGVGSLLVNKKEVKEAIVYGNEKIQYVIAGRDSVNVPLSNGMTEGMEAVFVMDKNGKTDLVIPQVFDNDTARISFLKLVTIHVENDFKPTEEVVMLDEWANKLSQKTFSGEGSVTMTSYLPQKITYDIDVNGKQLAVFSEVFYPEGWKATVDGKEVPILKVNYLLRGIEVPTGKHKIEFVFDSEEFHSLNRVALIGSIILILLTIAVTYFERKKKQKENTL